MSAPRLMTFARRIYALSVEVSVVNHPSSFELGARQRALRHQLEHRADSEPRLKPFAHCLLNLRSQMQMRVCQLRAHQKLVHCLAPGDDDSKLAAKAGNRTQHVLDRARVDVLASNDEHVVDPAIQTIRQARRRCPAIGAFLADGRTRHWSSTASSPPCCPCRCKHPRKSARSGAWSREFRLRARPKKGGAEIPMRLGRFPRAGRLPQNGARRKAFRRMRWAGSRASIEPPSAFDPRC